MKTSNILIISTLATIMLASCDEQNVKMRTIIHKDGTCTRKVSYNNMMPEEQRDSLWGDSIGLSQPLPDCLNEEDFSNMNTTIGEDNTVTTTFHRTFNSVEEMSQQMPIRLNGERLKSKAKLEKRFRWFYTEYTFTETFSCVGDSFKLAATDYANKDIVSFWFTGEPNLLQGLSGAEASQKLKDMERFATNWLNDNIFQVCFDYIVNHYDSITNPPVSRERFCQLHDSLATHLMKGIDFITETNPKEEFYSFFHSNAYSMFFDEKSPYCNEMYEEIISIMNISWLNVPYSLTMPGTILDTGNGTLVGKEIIYPLTGERLIPHDYTITASSRVTNIWAYVITLLLILLAIGSFLIRKKN